MFKNISLSGNRFTTVDKDTFEWAQKYSWSVNGQGYVQRSSRQNGKEIKIYLHREILNAFKSESIDHINGNKLDNRKQNLRKCITKENIRNRKLNKNNTSGYKGVSWSKLHKKWISYIRVDKKRIHLGLFTCKIDAAKVYNNAAIKYFGEFARLNEVK